MLLYHYMSLSFFMAEVRKYSQEDLALDPVRLQRSASVYYSPFTSHLNTFFFIASRN
jgi:hypothetical protein